MISKIIALLFFISTSAFADEPDWLGPYLKSKSIRCDLTQDQLSDQITTHMDFNVQQLGENLKARGSEIESISQQRDQVEIGTFPRSAIFDFYALVKVAVVIQKLSFWVQTTVDTDYSSNPRVENGLWFPLTITDLGAGKPCTLSRITYKEDRQKFVPLVELVIGQPPRVVASNIVQVMDPADALQTPIPASKPEAKLKEVPRAKQSVEKDTEKPVTVRESRSRKHRYEKRSSRRSYSRKYSRRRQRRDRAQDVKEQAPADSATAPAQPSDCTAPDTPLKVAACRFGIIK